MFIIILLFTVYRHFLRMTLQLKMLLVVAGVSSSISKMTSYDEFSGDKIFGATGVNQVCLM